MAWNPFSKKAKDEKAVAPNADGHLSEREHSGTSASEGDFAVLSQRFGHWFQIKAQPVLRQLDWRLIRGCTLVLGLSYVLASSANTFAAHIALNQFGALQKRSARASSEISADGSPLKLNASPSASTLKAAILKRNLFNSEGTLAPDPLSEDGKVKKTLDLNFAAVPCTKEKLPVEVIGIISTGDPKKGLVSIKDPKVTDADVYEPGKVIIDHEDYEVYLVRAGTVEFRKGDQKICVSLPGREDTAGGVQTAAANSSAPRPENTETIEVSAAELAELIGPGAANAMSAGKLIPEIQPGTGKTLGFKLLSIVSGSIFDRLKLQNEDLIAEVNGVSLQDATKGYKLYESLQQEREITIAFTRKGEPMVRKVRVK